MIADLSNYIYENVIIYGICGLILATLMSMYFVPAFRELAKAKDFTDTPSARKSHSLQVPILGGVAIYFAVLFTITIFAFFFSDSILSNTSLQEDSITNWTNNRGLILGFGATTLVVIGVLDDIFGLKPITKLLFQISVAAIVLYTLHLCIENMNGLFGLFELPTSISLILSLFVYVVFMNMLNLIDGIDGLASGLSMIALILFAYVSYRVCSSFNLLVCMSCIGSLIPFMYFNMFSEKKIFLGDNGSLMLGFTLGFLTLELLNLDNNTETSVFGDNTPLVLMSLFSFPLVDTLRVFTIRVLRKGNPFSADKNHIHHHLLRLGLSHRQATLLILIYTVLITIISLFLLEVNINIAFVVLLTVSVFCISLPTFLKHKTDGSIQFKYRH